MAYLLKEIYNRHFFSELTAALGETTGNFSKTRFMKLAIDADWEKRELKQRMKHLANVLHAMLPGDYPQQAEAVSKLCKVLRKNGRAENSLEYMFLGEFIEQYGLDDLETSIRALENVTRFTSCEYAVRPLIVRYPEKMIAQMHRWSLDKNTNLRRFSSEGCRPRLPWGMALHALQKDPAPILPILENLKNDPELFVRKSVANNLNDISKDHPQLVAAIAKKWKGKTPQTDWIVRHGCRTMLKKGDTGVLALFGHASGLDVAVSDLRADPEIAIGDHLGFSFALVHHEKKPAGLRVEYAIDYMKSSGKSSRKIFKITENTYAPGVPVAFQRRQSFADMTTRKHYPGRHRISIVVNGSPLAEKEFNVTR